MLAKASDSTKKIKDVLTDPAILEHLQMWNEGSNRKSFPPDAGIAEIGPREQTLTEKLTAYIEDSNDNRIKRKNTVTSPKAKEKAVPEVSPEENEGSNDTESKIVEEELGAKEVEENEPVNALVDESIPESKGDSTTLFEGLHETDLALANLLEKLPSIECLKRLDFASFKEKALASRKGGQGSHGHAAPTQAAEPIFKMLTDQIKALQSNLAVHDQFTKDAVRCYQSVILDIVVEMQTLRMDHDSRLLKLEQDLQETKTVRWVFVIYQMLMGLPNWAALLIATFFTSYISPIAISRPLEIIQNFAGEHLSSYEYNILKWTLCACIILVSIACTALVCQRAVLKLKGLGTKSWPDVTIQDTLDATYDDEECELRVQDMKGGIRITPAVEPQTIHAKDVPRSYASVAKLFRQHSKSSRREELTDEAATKISPLIPAIAANVSIYEEPRTPDAEKYMASEADAPKSPPSPASVAAPPLADGSRKSIREWIA